MPNVAVSTNFGSLATYTYPGGYDSSKLGLGPLMMQANDAGFEGKWVGPIPVSVARPMETSATVPGVMPAVIPWSSTYDWVILGDNATASATRRFELFTFNKTVRSNQWGFQGYITVTLPSSGTQGTYVNRGHVAAYQTYTTGTASVNNGSTSVTGSGTAWSASRLFIGSRIGFGTTDPSQVSTWYEISAIGSDTSITLTSNFLQTNISGQPYVIEDLRLVFVATNGTTVSNAGVFMVGGLRLENFQSGGFSIAAATTVDKIRACYWLGDGNATNNATIQSYGGIDLDTMTSWTSQYVYALDAPAGQSRFQVTNIRAPMTLTLGRDAVSSNTWVLNTGQQAVTGTISQNSAVIIATPNHGPRSGKKQVFWVTTTRIYSALVSAMTSGSVVFQGGSAVEVPPGSTTTFAATGALSTLVYSNMLDKFIVFTTGATAFRHYVTQYREDGGQWDRIFLVDNKQLNQSTADGTTTPAPALLSVLPSAATNGAGMIYMVTAGTTAQTNFLYNIPTGADWETASSTNCRVVLPAMSLSGFASLIAGYMNALEVLGGRTGTNLGIEPGAVRMYYRTTGISNNLGSWTLLDYSGDMSSVGIGSATQIQAMLEFRTITTTAVMPRVTRVGFEGSGTASDPHFQFSQNLSSSTSKQFVWRYSTAFGGTVPKLYVRIYDGVTGSLLVTDDSVTAAGTWQKSTDGVTFGSFNTSDRANETTYVRFTPSSLADNINALPVISLS